MNDYGVDWLVVRTVYGEGNSITISPKRSLKQENLISCVSYSPYGSKFATGSKRQVRVYESDTGRVLNVFESEDGRKKVLGHTEKEQDDEGMPYIRSLRFSPDGNFVCAGTEDQCVSVWELSSGDRVHSLSGHRSYIYGLDFTHNGSHIVSGSSDGTTKVWSMNTGRVVHTLGGCSIMNCNVNGVSSVKISRRSKYVASGHLDGTIRVYDLEKGKLINTLKGAHDDAAQSLSFHPLVEDVLASGSFDKKIRVWDVSAKRPCLRTLEGHRDFVLSVSFSQPDGRWILSGSKDMTVQFWEARGDRFFLHLMLQGHGNSVMGVDHHPNGRKKEFITVSADKRCRVWEY